MKNDLNNRNEAWWRPALILFGKLSSWIIAPVILGTILGEYLDKKFETEPLMLIIIVGFSFVVSMVGLVRETLREYRKIEKETNEKKKRTRS